jgi:hypothetical protein
LIKICSINLTIQFCCAEFIGVIIISTTNFDSNPIKI